MPSRWGGAVGEHEVDELFGDGFEGDVVGAGDRVCRVRVGQVSAASRSPTAVDKLSAHYGIPVGNLLVGTDRPAHCLPAGRRAPPAPGAAQLTIHP
ncbi:hypothetical protein [Streptomyces anulatus]|uniref:hypothetical protein n=1 Tax=Streptomyces anulatus TaxID=1892 RepID=UPI0036A411B9